MTTRLFRLPLSRTFYPHVIIIGIVKIREPLHSAVDESNANNVGSKE